MIERDESNKDAYDTLLWFYKEYKAWLDTGASEDNQLFSRLCGLCYSLTLFCYGNDLNDIRLQCKDLLQKQFESAGLDKLYPFGGFEYEVSRLNENMHLDPKRIKWVEDKIKEMENV